MIILAIETSCDETAIAVVECGGIKRGAPNFSAKGGSASGGKILSNIVSSQVKVHAPFWGVVPNLAKREHQKNLPLVLIKALKEGRFPISNFQFPISKHSELKVQQIEKILEREPELLEQFKKSILSLKPPKIDIIAVTHGPGLEPALWVGVNFAKALGFFWKKPIIGINHLEGHALANWLAPVGKKSQFPISNFQKVFPALCLIVSGGHTQLVLMKDFGKYRTIGETRDDAAGEAFDKVARMLKLGYPGGPAIAKIASDIKNQKSPQLRSGQAKIKNIKLPRPMINSKDYDFSFSGLKTAVLYLIKDLEKNGYALNDFRAAIAAEFQQAVIDVLISKTLKAAENYKVKSVLLGGGVSANKNLRRQMEKAVKEKLPKVIYHEPGLKFTTDNAAMIAAAACFHLKRKKDWSKIETAANLRLG